MHKSETASYTEHLTLPLDHDAARHSRMRGESQHITRAVIEPGEHLDVGAITQL